MIVHEDKAACLILYHELNELQRIQGHTVRITSNVMLVKSTYTLGITDEYDELLLFLQHHDITSALHYDR